MRNFLEILPCLGQVAGVSPRVEEVVAIGVESKIKLARVADFHDGVSEHLRFDFGESFLASIGLRAGIRRSAYLAPVEVKVSVAVGAHATWKRAAPGFSPQSLSVMRVLESFTIGEIG